MHFVAAVLTMSEPRDLGRAVGDSASTWFATVGPRGRGEVRAFTAAGEAVEGDVSSGPFRPTVFLYDNYPGGIGLSAPLFHQAGEVVARARSLVAGCPCRSGCPACVGPILATDETRGFSPKAVALAVLDLLAAPGPSG
jgi:DEAD/DEAH box helicase domain-containing protein